MGIYVETMEGESQDKGVNVWWHRILSWKWSTRLNKRSKSSIVGTGLAPVLAAALGEVGRGQDSGEVGSVKP
jgi:hypothetical protein